MAVAICSIATSMGPATAFAPDSAARRQMRRLDSLPVQRTLASTTTTTTTARRSSSSLHMVWWFGGNEAQETEDGDSCELVAVRIDRTSPNSRRIGGEITVERPLEDVWSILTDYDNLAIHVPNLVESRRLSSGSVGEQGDGSFTCRLFQKGAQKIIGFQFAATVTLDMTESIVSATEGTQQRKIGFKCVDSQFFSEFDGEWTAIENPMPDPVTGEKTTTIKYVVDVRPKGPVPVAALEWRIREDVPTNLRAVKKAAIEVGQEGVLAMRQRHDSSPVRRALAQDTTRSPARQNEIRANGTVGKRRAATAAAVAAGGAAKRTARNVVGKAGEAVTAAAANVVSKTRPRQLAPVRVDWYEDETMATYLDD